MAVEHSALDEVFLPRKKLKQLISGLPTPFFLYDEVGIRPEYPEFFPGVFLCRGHRQIFPLRQLPWTVWPGFSWKRGAASLAAPIRNCGRPPSGAFRGIVGV